MNNQSDELAKDLAQSITRRGALKKFGVGLAAVALYAALNLNAQTAFTYQGKLTDGGSPATGYYDLTFKVFDDPTAGTQLPTPTPITVTTNGVPVTNGLFTVRLDFDAPGSTVSTVFTGARRWLQIQARTNNSPAGFVLLLPRTELTPSPYALYAQNAAMVPNGAITPAMISSSGALAGQTLTFNGTSVGWATRSGIWSLNPANDAYYTGGKVGIGTANPASKLHVASSAGDAPARLQSSGTAGFSAGWDFYQGAVGKGYVGVPDSGAAFAPGEMLLFGGAGTRASLWAGGARAVTVEPSGNVGIGTTGPGKKLDVWTSASGDVAQWATSAGGGQGLIFGIDTSNSRTYWKQNTSGYEYSFQDSGGIPLVTIKNDGNVGIGTTPDKKLHVFGSGDVEIGLESGNFFGRLWTIQSGGDGNFHIIDGLAQASRLSIRTDGNVGIGINNPKRPLDVAGDIGWANNASVLQSDQTGSIELGAWIATGTAPYIDFHYGVGAQQDYNVRIQNDSDGQLTVSGNLRVTKALTIMGGADLAEPFQMSKQAPKGALVRIDEQNPGQLKMSDRAYDTRVAGIVSGANGVNPGIQLHQEGVLEGGQNVALSGRVYALADASEAPIKPGDLLTTSAMPGHCMKVTDHARAAGAIIGKAMSSVESGKGMVLVLVSLQ